MIWKCPKCGHTTVALTEKMAKSRHAMKSCNRTVPMRRKSTPIRKSSIEYFSAITSGNCHE